MESKLYTVKEVAEILKLSQSTVRKLIRNKDLPMTLIGSQWRITNEQLMSYIEGNKWTGQTNDM